MHAMILGSVLSLLAGGDCGWREIGNGEMEYIVQLNADDLQTLRDGKGLEAAIPPQLGNFRRYHIQMGTGAVPREPSLAELMKRDKAEKKSVKFEVPNPASANTEHAVTKSQGALSKVLRPYPRAPGTGPEGTSPSASTTARGDKSLGSPSPDRKVAKPAAASSPGQGKLAVAPGENEQSPQNSTDDAAAGTMPPWLPIAMALALATSIVANFYFGWVTLETRARYREMLYMRGDQDPLFNRAPDLDDEASSDGEKEHDAHSRTQRD